MHNKQNLFKALQRRFDEIFLLKLDDIKDHEDFKFFLNRVVDYYIYLKDNFPEFLKSMDEYSKIVEKESEQSIQEALPLILKIKDIVVALYENELFKVIYEQGKKQFHTVLGGGVHSVSIEESIYISLSAIEQTLLTFPENIMSPYAISESLKNVLRVIYDLETLQSEHLISDSLLIKHDIQKAIELCEKVYTKAMRVFDYMRLNSKVKIEQLWQYIHNDMDEHGILRMTLGSIIRGSYTPNNQDIIQMIKNSYKDYNLYIQRLHNSFLDWLDDKYFIEEALLNLKVWGEVVNNFKLLETFNNEENNSKKKEHIFHEEIRTFLFTTYLILAIREPHFKTKRPDLLFDYKGKKVLSEVKLFQEDGTKKSLIIKIKEGILQLHGYTLLANNAEAFVVIIFNGNKSVAISNDLVETTFLDKPLFVLPINFNSTPSEVKNNIDITQEDVKNAIHDMQ